MLYIKYHFHALENTDIFFLVQEKSVLLRHARTYALKFSILSLFHARHTEKRKIKRNVEPATYSD